LGEVAAVLSLRGDTDLVLESTAPPPRPGEVNLAILAQRVGLSVPTLERLRSVRDRAGASLTTREVATRLGIQQRTARRLLHRLELAGLAERTGNLTSGGSGRPLTLYRLTL
jgi:response regulator of citrate/malate metabolism